MTMVSEELDKHLSTWPQETCLVVENMIEDIIRWADAGAADLMRGRETEQEVLDILDAP